MKQRTQNNLAAFAAGVLFIIALALALDANATDKPKDDGIDVDQHQDQDQDQEQWQSQIAKSDAAANSEANNEGNSLEVNTKYESGPANLVLVPANNTSTCIKVWGFSGGNREGSTMFGWPTRDKQCDFQKAADDAAATGDHETAWFWRCQKKSLYKPFKAKGVSKADAINACHVRMIGEVGKVDTINRLRDNLRVLSNERTEDRRECEAEKKRINKDFAESNRRVLEACQGK